LILVFDLRAGVPLLLRYCNTRLLHDSTTPLLRYSVTPLSCRSISQGASVIEQGLGGYGVISPKTVDYLSNAEFIKNVEARSDIQAIDKMLAVLNGRSDVTDAAELRRAVFERQKMDPPLLPGGTAIPHARTDSVRSVVMVIATSLSPIMFGEVPVRLIFLIGVPNAAVSEYLQITSFLARNLRGGHLIDRLVNAENIQEFVAAFADR
jgi:mannitol/fructose-specific phosphotransferase system IIA component (Ntr-type)